MNSNLSSSQPLNRELAELIEDISQRKLENPILALGLASLYAEHGKNDEAIAIIEKLIAADIQTVEILLALGEVYESTNLHQQAKDNYDKAIKLSSQLLVAAHAGLARVEESLGNSAEAHGLHQESISKFAALADIEKSSDLGQRLDDLIQNKHKFLFLKTSGGCGSCPGPGYKYGWMCLPCGG